MRKRNSLETRFGAPNTVSTRVHFNPGLKNAKYPRTFYRVGMESNWSEMGLSLQFNRPGDQSEAVSVSSKCRGWLKTTSKSHWSRLCPAGYHRWQPRAAFLLQPPGGELGERADR